MIPDFEKINERMEQASLNEFVPGFDQDEVWSKLSQRLHPGRKKLVTLSYAASLLILLGILGWFVLSQHSASTAQVSIHNIETTVQNEARRNPKTDNISISGSNTLKNKQVVDEDTHENKNIDPDKDRTQHPLKTAGGYITKKVISNHTPCPLQICISQTMRCPNIEPATISSCSTLEPDQSGKLAYKAHDRVAKECSLTVNEIEIKSIATGETILLTSNSSPVTADDVFSYMTGQKKGDICAGMLTYDCDHKTVKHDLRLNNSYGGLRIE